MRNRGATVVDLARVRRALAALDKLVAAHPELRGELEQRRLDGKVRSLWRNRSGDV